MERVESICSVVVMCPKKDSIVPLGYDETNL